MLRAYGSTDATVVSGKVRGPAAGKGRGGGNGKGPNGGGGGGGDSVVLLMHFDGTTGDLVYTDSSSYARTVSLGGGYRPELDSTTKKFGTASLEFFGVGTGWLTTPDATELNFGSSDFTLEWWAYPNGINGGVASIALFGKRANSGVGGFAVGYTQDGILQAYATVNGTTWGVSLVSAQYVYPNGASRFYHSAFVREGNVWSLYCDGNRVATTTVAGTIPTNTAPLSIGAWSAAGNPANEGTYGFIDDIRISNGLARYSGATYTIPTEAFPNP